MGSPVNLILGTEYLDRKNKTGLDRYTSTLLEHINDKAFSGEVGTFSYDASPFEFPHFRLHGSRRWNSLKSLAGYGISIETKGNSDIVHATTPLCIKAKGRLVVTIHDLAPVFFPDVYPKYMSVIYKSTLRYLKNKDAYFIANSKHTAEDIKGYLNLSDHQVSVTYLGIDHNLFRPIVSERVDICKKYNLPERYFCFTGSLNKRKNLYYALDSYFEYVNSSRDPIHFVLAGRYEWGGEELMKYVFRKFGEQKLIHFPGYIRDADLANFYYSSEALVYPSIYEGFGFPPLEALASGTRAIVSDRGALPEIVGDEGITINIDDISSLTQVFLDIENQRIPRPDSEQVQQWLRKFSWESTINSTIDIYNNLA
jgi:glycosyltransferase involved in cell wall biosynthesis